MVLSLMKVLLQNRLRTGMQIVGEKHFELPSGFQYLYLFYERKGLPFEPNDLVIASIVIANKGILVIHNTDEFGRIDELVVEDWF